MRSRGTRTWPEPLLTAGVPAAAVMGLAAASHHDDPVVWDIATAGFVVVLATVWSRRRPRLSASAHLRIAALTALTALAALSVAWSSDRPATAAAVQQWIMFTAAFTCFAALAAASRPEQLAAGVAIAATGVSTWAVAQRLLPGLFGSTSAGEVHRLTGPLVYWNALGGLAALGLLLCGGLAVGAPRRLRMLCAAAAVPLSLALYLTFSRGALLALAVGTVLALAGVRARRETALHAAVIVVPSLLAVAIVNGFPALTHAFPSASQQAEQGREALVLLLGVLAVSAWVATQWRSVRRPLRDVRPYRAFERRVGRAPAALAIGTVLVLTVGLVAVRLAGTEGQSSPHFAGGDLNLRLFSLSANSRGDVWRVAWSDFADHPLLGSGDGTFAYEWAQRGHEPFSTTAAHSLYLETAAELGVVGVGLLCLFLAVSARAWRPPRSPVLAAATGGVAGLLVQCAFDWTWDVSAVTVAALACLATLEAGDAAVSRVGGDIRSAAGRQDMEAAA